MLQQEELVNSWLSATDRPNILVVAAADAIYARCAMGLRSGDHPCEVVCLDSLSDARRLLRRGAIAVVVLSESQETAGGLELILEGLSKARPPRYILAAKNTPAASDEKSPLIRVVGSSPAAMRDAILISAVEFERGSPYALSVRSLLEATAGFPEQVWIKASKADGEFCDLCLNAGRLVYAECGRLMGAAAVEKALSWRNCQYECRELPSFLQSNMSWGLGELGNLDRIRIAELNPATPAANSGESECEEPTEFPTLDLLPAAVEVPAGLAPAVSAPIVFPVAEDPEEPSFDPKNFHEEIVVEEPFEMALQPDREFVTSLDVEEPELPDFGASVSLDAGYSTHLTGSVFEAVAVIAQGSSHLEICQPQQSAPLFDPPALREVFDLATRCSLPQQAGELKFVQLTAENGTIVVAPIQGGRLVAVWVPKSEFGALEHVELNRLQNNLQAIPPVSPG